MARPPTEQAWRRVREWLKKRRRYYAEAAQRNPGVFGREADRLRGDLLQGVLSVMAVELRQARRRRDD